MKVYTGVSRAAYFGIAVEAKKENFPFVGHVPLEVGVDEASNAEQQSVEHLMGILLYSSSKSDELIADLMKGMNSNLLNNQMLDTYDPAKASTLFALFVKNATWQVPTLTIRHARPYLKELQASNDFWPAWPDSVLAHDIRVGRHSPASAHLWVDGQTNQNCSEGATRSTIFT